MTAVTGARHAVAFSSGTAALHGAAVAAGLGPGDEAITTPMTFVATANAVLYTGAEVTLRRRRCRAPCSSIRTWSQAAVTAAHAGDPAGRLRRAAGRLRRHPPHRGRRRRGGPLTVIADASHSLGATRDGQSVGTHGRHDGPQPPSGEDHHDRRGRRRPDRRRRPGRPAATVPEPRHRHGAGRPDATGPTPWSSSATTTG